MTLLLWLLRARVLVRGVWRGLYPTVYVRMGDGIAFTWRTGYTHAGRRWAEAMQKREFIEFVHDDGRRLWVNARQIVYIAGKKWWAR